MNPSNPASRTSRHCQQIPTTHHGKERERHTDGEETHTAATKASGRGVSTVTALCDSGAKLWHGHRHSLVDSSRKKLSHRQSISSFVWLRGSACYLGPLNNNIQNILLKYRLLLQGYADQNVFINR